jgi:hypothetical protein
MPTLEGVKASVLGVALTNKNPGSESYITYLGNLDAQLAANGETRTKEPIPFYKEGVKDPAGYVIETGSQVMVCYHGTQFGKIFGSGAKEVMHDLQTGQESMKFGDKNLKVHRGFKAEYEASKNSLFEALGKVDKSKTVNVAGHSLGGATSQIFALDAAANHPEIKIGEVHTYGGPRVLSIEAAKEYNTIGLGDRTLRVKQKYDPVPRLVSKKDGYAHVGDKISVHSGAKSIHSGSVCRKIGSKVLTKEDISGARKSDEPMDIETYRDAISRLTKETFMAAITFVNKISGSISKAAVEKASAVQNKTKEFVISMVKKFMKQSSADVVRHNVVPIGKSRIQDQGHYK